MTIRSDVRHAVACLKAAARAIDVPDAKGLRLLDRIRDHSAGPGASKLDGARASAGPGYSDPTGSAVASARTDRARADEHRVGEIVRTIKDLSAELLVIAASYETRPASAFERSQTARKNQPHCESCARLTIAPKEPWLVEPLTKERTTVGDRLPKAQWLCRGCYEHVIDTGFVPTPDELEERRQHGRIRRCPHPKVPAA